MAEAIDTDEKIARFQREVLPTLVARYRPSKVLVFGSRARGEARRHSDLDVLIVAEAFREVRWLDRAYRVSMDCDIRLDAELLCYTPEEYARKIEELGIVRTATEEGVDLVTGVGVAAGRVAEPRRPAPERVRAWFAQAERDLEVAKVARRSGHHEWACFAAQQGAEKGVKAVHLHLGREARGHALTRLLDDLAPDLAVAREVVDNARALDSAYLAARYPNSHAAGAPFEHYGASESEAAIREAREILEWCRARMEGARSP